VVTPDCRTAHGRARRESRGARPFGPGPRNSERSGVPQDEEAKAFNRCDRLLSVSLEAMGKVARDGTITAVINSNGKI
jgi:hypothetical protein